MQKLINYNRKGSERVVGYSWRQVFAHSLFPLHFVLFSSFPSGS